MSVIHISSHKKVDKKPEMKCIVTGFPITLNYMRSEAEKKRKDYKIVLETDDNDVKIAIPIPVRSLSYVSLVADCDMDFIDKSLYTFDEVHRTEFHNLCLALKKFYESCFRVKILSYKFVEMDREDT